MFGKVVELAIQKGLTIKTMESCTGGAVASALTDIEGASGILKESYVTYSNESKIRHGVPSEIIEKYSVYSEETAIAMAKACKEHGIKSDIGIGVTGNFSNIDPANEKSSVPGIVYVAILLGNQMKVKIMTLELNKSRKALKQVVCQEIASMLEKLLDEYNEEK